MAYGESQRNNGFKIGGENSIPQDSVSGSSVSYDGTFFFLDRMTIVELILEIFELGISKFFQFAKYVGFVIHNLYICIVAKYLFA